MTDNLPESLMARLSDFVATAMGLNFPRARWGDLERQAKLAAKELGFASIEQFLQRLLSSPLTQEQIELLASHLTIAETYFWREPLVFEALRSQILPDLIRERENGNKRLRIWSAGCATGEEPYSIAIALRQVLPQIEEWNITLLATDINPHLLRRAEAGQFGEWSFRNVPARFKKSYFRSTDNGKFEILPKIRKMVTFAYLNLGEDTFPSPVNNTNAMDLIFCRNVLMYFTSERARLVGEHFYQTLGEGGWLIVAASELSQHVFPQFNSVHFPGAILYHREGGKHELLGTQTPKSKSDQRMPAQPPLNRLVPEPNPHRSAIKPPVKVEEAASQATPPLVGSQLVLALANQGELIKAYAACEQAIATDKLNPGLNYLSAIILQEMNREDEATAALKRTLYLDPNFVLAHFALGTLAQRLGKKDSARKNFKNALTILSSYDPDDILPEADGLTAGRLKEIIRATFQTGPMT
jgi:chemotaxis protein methyltransferase CheR